MTAKKKAAPMGPEPAPVTPAPVDHSPLDGWFELAPRTMKRYVQAVVGAASTDPSRPILCGVYVDANSDRLILVATDSYRLYRITHPWTTTLKACRGIVPAEWLSRVVRSPFASFEPTMRFTFDKGRVNVAYTTDSKRREMMSTETIVGKVDESAYPNFEPIIDGPLSAKSVGYPVAFNPDYLGGVLRAAKLFRGTAERMPVRVHGLDALKACLFQVVDPDSKAVFDMLLMPVRVPS